MLTIEGFFPSVIQAPVGFRPAIYDATAVLGMLHDHHVSGRLVPEAFALDQNWLLTGVRIQRFSILHFFSCNFDPS